jgi:hypothetical protein
MSRQQLDALWTYVSHKWKRVPEEECGAYWRGPATDTDTRLQIGRPIAKAEEEAAQELLE